MLHIQTTYTEAICRVEIVDWDGQVLRTFELDECEGAPHDARIVRRSTLVGALRSAIPPHLIRYGVSVADVHMHEQGRHFLIFSGSSLMSSHLEGHAGTRSQGCHICKAVHARSYELALMWAY